MRWAFDIQRKIRLAIMLAIMMLFIIIFSLVESYNITRISRSFNSIYEDRLIPAVDLYSMADHIHNKHHQLFTFLFTENITTYEIKQYLHKANADLDKLISKYENTYLVKAEYNHLERLKKNLKNYQRDELLLLSAAADNKAEAQKLYLNNTIGLFKELSADLMALTQVQTRIGKELLEESKKSKASSAFITQLNVAITIILGLIIIILLITNKQVMIKQEKFNLN